MVAETIFSFQTTTEAKELSSVDFRKKLHQKTPSRTTGKYDLQNLFKELFDSGTSNPSEYIRDSDEFALEQAASKADEAEFLRAASYIDWSTRSAQVYVNSIRLALQAGAHGFARQLSQEGGKKFPEFEEMQKLASLLAPGKIISKQLPSNHEVGLDSGWLKKHRDEYHGQWVALRAGELLCAAPTAKALLAHLENPKDKSILVTKVY